MQRSYMKKNLWRHCRGGGGGGLLYGVDGGGGAAQCMAGGGGGGITVGELTPTWTRPRRSSYQAGCSVAASTKGGIPVRRISCI